jgi:flagellar biosynthesis/type III secretory pathway M-ring protein FliF/YscJ
LDEILKKNPALVAAAAGLVLLLLVVALWRLGRRKRGRARVEMTPELPPGAPPVSLEAAAQPAAENLEARLAEQEARQQQLEAEALNALKLPPVTTKKTEILTKHLAETVKKNPASAAQILRSWLYEKKARDRSCGIPEQVKP